jgi:tRNA threonylcarbamoyl adenosine modification protein YeaZ
MILAIDCSASLCAACVYDSKIHVELGREVLDPGKGHAEHLMAVIEEALRQAGRGYADLSAVAVSVGPGSFTGLRVGVATARGLALALRIPAIGVTTLEALAEAARPAFPERTVLAVLDGGRGDIHAALYDELAVLRYGPAAITLEGAAAMASAQPVTPPVLAGTAAARVAAATGRAFDIGPTDATADIGVYARLAAGKTPGEKPKPLYLRDADAKPQAGFVLPRAGG